MGGGGPILLALDQGTSSSKAAVIDGSGRVLGSGSAPVRSRQGPRGAVHQDARQLLASQQAAIRKACSQAGHPRLDAAGVASQRSTFVVWDAATGRPLGPAPTWQSTEASDLCLRLAPYAAQVRRRTGLYLSPHYSASKLSQIVSRNRALPARARRGEVISGSVATWLIWKLTGRRVHAIDPTLAARTLLFSLRGARWDPWLLDLFGIPRAMLPESRDSIADYGEMRLDGRAVPIRACMGDQQAALHAVMRGDGTGARRALVNYGTGAFVLIPTGRRVVRRPGLLTSFAVTQGAPRHVLEATINPAGAALDWLRRELGAPGDLRRLDAICRSAPDGCALLASFWGMGSLDMDPPGMPRAPAAAIGLSPVSTRAQLARAAVESIAHAVAEAIARAGGRKRVGRLVASGGLAAIGYLIEYQASLLGVPIEVEPEGRWHEATLYGAARAAARALGHDLPLMRPQRVTAPVRRLRAGAREGHARWLRLRTMAQRWAADAGGAA